YVPMAKEEKIPVVGLFTGAQMLYEPLKHEIINVRASYYDETREQIEKLWDLNIRKIGVIYQDGSFWQGRAGWRETGPAKAQCRSGRAGDVRTQHARNRGGHAGRNGGASPGR